MKFTDAI